MRFSLATLIPFATNPPGRCGPRAGTLRSSCLSRDGGIAGKVAWDLGNGPDTRTIGVAVEVGRIDKQRMHARGPCAGDIDMVEVAHVKRPAGDRIGTSHR